MAKLTFYGGLNSIGGNKILLEDSDTRIFLDFGMDFGKQAKYFEEYMKPRVGNGLGDWAEMGLIPHPKKLKGFYRNDLLKIGNFPIEEVAFDGVLVSHCHLDHTGHLCFMDEGIPVYSSKVTKKMVEVIQETGMGTIETELYKHKLRPVVRGQEPIERQWNAVESGKKFKIGDIEIKPFAVDHSVPGAMSFLIYASDKTIFYSGDFRKHGTYGYLTEEMLKEMENENVDLMLCEGTRVSETENQSEQMVKKKSHKIISKSKGLVIADYAYKDLTRFKTFYEIAKENKRKFAIGLRDALFVRELGSLIDLPSLDDENLLIYLDKRCSGTYCEKDYSKKWMKELYGLDNTMTAEEISRQQKDIIVRMSFFDFNDLVDLKPKPGSEYIHSMCEAFNEEMEFNEKRLHNWLKHFKLPYRFAHCSGHANGIELKEIITGINPKKLTPIHTEKPKEFKKIVSKKTKVEFKS